MVDKDALAFRKKLRRAEVEREILRKDKALAETAALLGLTSSTVSSYTKNIYGKLAVSSRSEAVYEATRMGLINSRS